MTTNKDTLLKRDDEERLHTGKWTSEEEEYVQGLIDEFQDGYLSLPDGTSLRQFLSKMLNCSPKRISKKFEGNNYARGRKFYVRNTRELNPDEVQARRKKLSELECEYKRRLRELEVPHFLGDERDQNAERSEKMADQIEDCIPASLVGNSVLVYPPEEPGISALGTQSVTSRPLSSISSLPNRNVDPVLLSDLSNRLGELSAVSRPSMEVNTSLPHTIRALFSQLDGAPKSALASQLRSQQNVAQRIPNLFEMQRLFSRGDSAAASAFASQPNRMDELSSLLQIYGFGQQPNLDLSSFLIGAQRIQNNQSNAKGLSSLLHYYPFFSSSHLNSLLLPSDLQAAQSSPLHILDRVDGSQQVRDLLGGQLQAATPVNQQAVQRASSYAGSSLLFQDPQMWTLMHSQVDPSIQTNNEEDNSRKRKTKKDDKEDGQDGSNTSRRRLDPRNGSGSDRI